MKHTTFATALVVQLQFLTISATADEGTEIVKLIQNAQRAGLIKHDLEKYMAIWAKDAQIISGRSEKAGTYDTVLKRDQIEATRKLRFKAKPFEEMKLEFKEVKVEVKDDKAEVRFQTLLTLQVGYLERINEVHKLRKTKDGWKVYENRFWPIEIGVPPNTIKYNSDTWNRFDASAKQYKASGDFGNHVNTLFRAFRYSEAYELCKKETKRRPNSISAWGWRGQTALLAGHAEDSLKSFRKVLEFDKNARVPEWVHANKK